MFTYKISLQNLPIKMKDMEPMISGNMNKTE